MLYLEIDSFVNNASGEDGRTHHLCCLKQCLCFCLLCPKTTCISQLSIDCRNYSLLEYTVGSAEIIQGMESIYSVIHHSVSSRHSSHHKELFIYVNGYQSQLVLCKTYFQFESQLTVGGSQFDDSRASSSVAQDFAKSRMIRRDKARQIICDQGKSCTISTSAHQRENAVRRNLAKSCTITRDPTVSR